MNKEIQVLKGLGGNFRSVNTEDLVVSMYILRGNMGRKCKERLLLPRLTLFAISLHFQ